ncbi:polyprenyl synthetase family protein [Mariniblastus fucicola]|uniref:Farnesyl diphosphate synthase n=1 Tax=Mariniblastus fucicola TaxID=980251 RepID=A0A5B9PLU3_9BACT|nr:farnesyl diphosphate synthase [Mariniblastus fucicola]QEG23651.1 Farnesyl diphosphate synthase [Mariniblastus fucicola]
MASTALFPPQIEAHRKLIQDALLRYCDFDSGCPEHLAEAIRYCLLAPGKRIRPLLTLAASEVCDGDLSAAIPAACAVEMIHNYSLIHDDLPAMDDDELRRGRPTCHIQFDEAIAILAGDALIPMAFEAIARDVQPAEVALECSRLLAIASGPSKLVGGQADDLGCEFGAHDRVMLEKIHSRKTGALLTVSLEMGAVTARADEDQRHSLVEYGKHLGLAFQIVDDLLDFRGSQTKMGKRTGKDADRGKLTYPSVLGEAESETFLHEITEKAIASIQSFGDAAKPLELLARFVVSRTQ